ncbi:MAG: manganese efflux pump MntP family protein [Clostridiales Family XIII bacterium]|jgi:putative Mn2+ efflux pump MntP|nr:manganese efflux pump MntP family protein [Clostridiales Family XIII bacterium]
MGFWELWIIAVGLSMDACAIAVSTGLSASGRRAKNALVCGLYFGVAQALMPLLGWLVGAQFAERITSVDHWIVFGILGFIGGKMIFDSFRGAQAPPDENPMRFARMFPLAIATSIDALAVGIGFSFIEVNIALAACFIGIVTFALSVAGFGAGRLAGAKFESKARLVGGVILVLMGVKILVEHIAG